MKVPSRRIAVLLVAGLIFAFSSGRLQAEDAGVEGTISVSPSRPGPIHPGETTKAAVAHTAFIVKQGKEKVTSFKTDANGHFRVTLPPGHYVVCREDSGAAVGKWQFEVTVETGKMATVQWIGDSGMR